MFRLTSITHRSRIFVPIPRSTHIGGLVNDFDRDSKSEERVELIDASESSSHDERVKVELLHLRAYGWSQSRAMSLLLQRKTQVMTDFMPTFSPITPEFDLPLGGPRSQWSKKMRGK